MTYRSFRKWLTFVLFILVFQTTSATIIHQSKIILPTNEETLVYTWLDIGKMENGSCHWEYIIQPVPYLLLHQGDIVPVNGDVLKKFVGPGNTCATINFQLPEDPESSVNHPIRRDHFLIVSNDIGDDYLTSRPFERLVKIK